MVFVKSHCWFLLSSQLLIKLKGVQCYKKFLRKILKKQTFLKFSFEIASIMAKKTFKNFLPQTTRLFFFKDIIHYR